jgi:hypothetical protein
MSEVTVTDVALVRVDHHEGRAGLGSSELKGDRISVITTGAFPPTTENKIKVRAVPANLPQRPLHDIGSLANVPPMNQARDGAGVVSAAWTRTEVVSVGHLDNAGRGLFGRRLTKESA